VEILALTDRRAVDYPFPLSEVFPDAPAEAWAPFRSRYPEAFGGPDTYRSHYGCYLIHSQGRTILVDTGAGSSATNPEMAATFLGGVDGSLMDELQAAGVRPEDVDTVFLTHLHPDHVGWNLTPQQDEPPLPTFSKARYLIHQADWDAFLTPEVQAHFPFSYVKETVEPLQDLGALELLTGERALTSEVTAIPTPGHTLGHMSLLIASEGQRAIVMGDVAIHPAQVTELSWNSMFEMEPAQAIETRQHLLDRLEREDMTIAAGHFPPPGFGRLIRLQDRRRYWQGL
jgi:glyoxylase-like metal-dependent hydrolase (beta-lactamase superfamily II)